MCLAGFLDLLCRIARVRPSCLHRAYAVLGPRYKFTEVLGQILRLATSIARHYSTRKCQISSSSGFSCLNGRIVKCAAEAHPSSYIPAAPIVLSEGPWEQVLGGVTAAKGFKAVGIYGGLRAVGKKPDLALVTCDVGCCSRR
ncbi:hypothetical protein KI387_043922 [Taxus chinensis]|uniref:Uncharacterized protein n=1 Tax=Taxus chinensis TaxID=29808 RepID=A0AA38GKC4_TAXCH|nr:hypothetical protein KI387_043922 [Taxus chinensis]